MPRRAKVDEKEVEDKVETLINKAKTVVKKAKVLTPVQLLDRAVQAFKWWEYQHTDDDIYWTTLQHNGVIFQPPYQPHGVPLYYNGKPVKLTPEQEEIATLYAMVGEDAIQLREEESAKIFKTNFFSYFKEEMGAGSVVKTLEKCDFSHIRQYLEERKKSTQKATAEEKQQQQLRMGYLIIDGNLQKTGNFLVEPPSLFRGRGLHPKMGSVKVRVQWCMMIIDARDSGAGGDQRGSEHGSAGVLDARTQLGDAGEAQRHVVLRALDGQRAGHGQVRGREQHVVSEGAARHGEVRDGAPAEEVHRHDPQAGAGGPAQQEHARAVALTYVCDA